MHIKTWVASSDSSKFGSNSFFLSFFPCCLSLFPCVLIFCLSFRLQEIMTSAKSQALRSTQTVSDDDPMDVDDDEVKVSPTRPPVLLLTNKHLSSPQPATPLCRVSLVSAPSFVCLLNFQSHTPFFVDVCRKLSFQSGINRELWSAALSLRTEIGASFAVQCHLLVTRWILIRQELNTNPALLHFE